MSSSLQPSKTILLIDIAHNSVGAGVLVVTPGFIPQLLATWRETFEHIDPSMERMFENTLRVTRKLIEKANSAGYANWDDIYCCVGSPWVLTHVRTAKYAQDKQFVVTEKLLNDLAQKDLERFFDRIDSDFGSILGNAKVLDHQRIMTRVNGHPMKNPAGQRAREIECSYLVSGMNTDQLSALRSALYAVCHREPTINAVQHTQLQAVQSLKGAKNYAVFDFHGGIGECSIVRDDTLTVTAATPISEESYLRDLGAGMGKNIREVTVLLDMRRNKVLEASVATRLADIERVIAKQYVGDFRNLLVAVAEHGLIPNHAFFIADIGSEFFEKLLSSHEYAPLTLVHATLKPIQLSVSLLHDTIDSSAAKKQDTALLLSALAFIYKHQ